MYADFKGRAIGVPEFRNVLQLSSGKSFLGESLLVVTAAVALVKEAVEEDNAGHYQRALELYKQALEWFQTHLKFEKNPHSRKAIMEKVR